MKLNISDVHYMDVNIWKTSSVYVDLSYVIDSHISCDIIDPFTEYLIFSIPDTRFSHLIGHFDSMYNEIS